jgi:hypothetical protein
MQGPESLRPLLEKILYTNSFLPLSYLLRVCLRGPLDTKLLRSWLIQLAARLDAVSLLRPLSASANLFYHEPIGRAGIFVFLFQRFLKFSNFVSRIRHILLFHLLLLIPGSGLCFYSSFSNSRATVRILLNNLRSRDRLLSCLLLNKTPLITP